MFVLADPPGDTGVVVEVVAAALGDVVAGLDPAVIRASDVTAMWSSFDRIARLAEGAKRLLASRVDTAGEWRGAGCANAAEFMALRSGSSIGAARAALDTSKALGNLDVVAAALRDGKLSGTQADLIADAATLNPHAERRLVERAPRQSNRELRDACGRAAAQGHPDPEQRRRRIHRKRYLRWRTNTDGSFSISGNGTLEDGERLIGALQPHIDAAFAANRNADHHPERDAYAWDALIARLGTSQPSPEKPSKYRALIRIDHSALVRGALDPTLDETCDIAGLGPISVARARQLLGDSILHLVITKGTSVATVCHLGRSPTLAQKLALSWNNTTTSCCVEGCQRTRLEIDHNHPWASDPVTHLANLTPLCGHHHDLKTYKGWALLDPDPTSGKRRMVPPGHCDHPG